MNTRPRRFFAAVTLAAALCIAPTASAQTATTFTYQGVITLAGAGSNDPADFRFRLYNAAENGAQVGPQVEVNNLTVTRGLFSANLDFGAVFSGASLWLEIEARSPAGSGVYTLVTPRQRISPTPRALFATTAASATTAESADAAHTVPWSGITGVPPNVALAPWTGVPNGILSNFNRVGINNASPHISLDVGPGEIIGNTTLLGSPSSPINRGEKVGFGYLIPSEQVFAGMVAQVEAGQDCPNAGNLSFRTWECLNFSTREVMKITGGGRVGIGTGTPDARLDIETPAIGAGWQMMFSNSSIITFRGGARLADNGFLEMTNSANLANPNFARLSGSGTWTAVSDARLKTDITSAEGLLDTALRLHPVNFRWKSDGAPGLGLIAQEARAVLPTLVVGDEAADTLTLDYNQISVVTLGAIKELKADNDAKQRRINELEARVAAIEAALARTTTPTNADTK